MAAGPDKERGAHPERAIVHVSADFPDPLNPAKTPAIRTLIGLVEGEAVRYPAPAWGILHRTMLVRLGEWLADHLSGAQTAKPAGAPPGLLVGHKLTIEGFIVAAAAKRLGIGYALSLQGNTDEKILRARPDLHPALRRIYHEAAVVFAFTPWARSAVEQRLGVREGPLHLLPCPTELDQPLAPQAPGRGFVSVFHLRHHRNKNLAGMIAAQRRLRQEGWAHELTIIGGGDPPMEQALGAMLGKDRDIHLAGPMARAALSGRLREAVGFVLPSLRESFGLVFIEAMFAGLPVIYPRGAAIDGYFSDHPFAIPVNPRDPEEIAAAMRHVARHEALLKARLGEWQQSTGARQFMRAGIAEVFRAGLAEAMGAGA